MWYFLYADYKISLVGICCLFQAWCKPIRSNRLCRSRSPCSMTVNFPKLGNFELAHSSCMYGSSQSVSLRISLGSILSFGSPWYEGDKVSTCHDNTCLMCWMPWIYAVENLRLRWSFVLSVILLKLYGIYLGFNRNAVIWYVAISVPVSYSGFVFHPPLNLRTWFIADTVFLALMSTTCIFSMDMHLFFGNASFLWPSKSSCIVLVPSFTYNSGYFEFFDWDFGARYLVS